MSRKIPIKPVDHVANAELALTKRLIADPREAKWSPGWSEVKDLGGGYIRRDFGMYRIEGCNKGAYNVLSHDNKEFGVGLSLGAAARECEALEAARIEQTKAAAAAFTKAKADAEKAKTDLKAAEEKKFNDAVAAAVAAQAKAPAKAGK